MKLLVNALSWILPCVLFQVISAVAIAGDAMPLDAPVAARESAATEESVSSHASPDPTPALLPALSRRSSFVTTAKLTSGVASDFQLTLGGEFSDGLAQQNGLVVDLKNLVRHGSTVRLTLWDTIDTGDRGHDWIGAINYLQPLKSWESGSLTLNLGLHRWQFPSVLTGGTDTVVDSGLIWSQSGPIGFTLDANVKTLATSGTRRGVGGQIYYFRGTTAHPLRRSGKFSLAVIHGPSFTYANRFYGCRGSRVFRYEAGLSLKHGSFGAEAMFRPQLAFQDRIPEHKFWSAGISYVLW